MNHGSQCDCMMCSVGKKVGVIKSADGGHEEGQIEGTCPNCGGATTEGTPHTCGA